MRRWLQDKEADYQKKFALGLEPKDYHTNCGRVKMLQETQTAMREFVRKIEGDGSERASSSIET